MIIKPVTGHCIYNDNTSSAYPQAITFSIGETLILSSFPQDLIRLILTTRTLLSFSIFT